MRGFFGGLRGYRHFADQRFTGSAWTEKISDRVVYGLQNGEYFNRFRVIKVNQIVLVSMVQVNICRKFVLRETNSSSIRRRCLHFLHSWPREWQTIGLDSQLSTSESVPPSVSLICMAIEIKMAQQCAQRKAKHVLSVPSTWRRFPLKTWIVCIHHFSPIKFALVILWMIADSIPWNSFSIQRIVCSHHPLRNLITC